MPQTRPSTVLFGEISGARRSAAEQSPTEVRAGVAEERADQNVDHDPVAVRRVAQQNRMRDGKADPTSPRAGSAAIASVGRRRSLRQSTARNVTGTLATAAPISACSPPSWAATHIPTTAATATTVHRPPLRQHRRELDDTSRAHHRRPPPSRPGHRSPRKRSPPTAAGIATRIRPTRSELLRARRDAVVLASPQRGPRNRCGRPPADRSPPRAPLRTRAATAACVRGPRRRGRGGPGAAS